MDVDVERKEQVWVLVKKASESFGIPFEDVDLFRQEEEVRRFLYEGHTISLAGLDDFDVITVSKKPRKLNISLRFKEKSVDLVVEKTALVEVLFKKASEHFGIPLEDVDLARDFVNVQMTLNEKDTLSEARLHDFGVVNVSVKQEMLNIRLQCQDDIADLVVSRKALANVLREKACYHFGIHRKEVKLLRNGRLLQLSDTITQAKVGDYEVIVVSIKSWGGGYFREGLMKILGEENPNAPWMGAIRREYGDLAEYPVIPLLSRTQTFPLLFQKKESQWIHTDMAHPQRLCRCLERRGCPGSVQAIHWARLHGPEPVPEFAPLSERGCV